MIFILLLCKGGMFIFTAHLQQAFGIDRKSISMRTFNNLQDIYIQVISQGPMPIQANH